MKRVSLKGVIIGSVTDMGATFLTVFALAIYVKSSHNLADLPKDQISSALIQILRNDPIFFSAQLLLGSLSSVLGGYVSARIAKRHELLNGSLAAFLCVGTGLCSLFFTSSSTPLWRHIFGLISSPLLSAFGGYLRLRAVRGKTNVQPGG